MIMLDGIRETMERRLEEDDTFPVFVMMLTDGSEASSNYSDNAYQRLINNLRLQGVTIHVIILTSRGGSAETRRAVHGHAHHGVAHGPLRAHVAGDQ